MSRQQDAKQLKASPLLAETLRDFRQALIDRWVDANELGAREATHAGIRMFDELAETLSERIKRALGDERTDEHRERDGH